MDVCGSQRISCSYTRMMQRTLTWASSVNQPSACAEHGTFRVRSHLDLRVPRRHLFLGTHWKFAWAPSVLWSNLTCFVGRVWLPSVCRSREKGQNVCACVFGVYSEFSAVSLLLCLPRSLFCPVFFFPLSPFSLISLSLHSLTHSLTLCLSFPLSLPLPLCHSLSPLCLFSLSLSLSLSPSLSLSLSRIHSLSLHHSLPRFVPCLSPWHKISWRTAHTEVIIALQHTSFYH